MRALLHANLRAAVRAADDVTVHNEPLRILVQSMRGGRSAPVFVDQGIDVERFARAREGGSAAASLDERRALLGLGEVR